MAISPRALSPYAGLIFIKGGAERPPFLLLSLHPLPTLPPRRALVDYECTERKTRVGRRSWSRGATTSDFLTALLIVLISRALPFSAT